MAYGQYPPYGYGNGNNNNYTGVAPNNGYVPGQSYTVGIAPYNGYAPGQNYGGMAYQAPPPQPQQMNTSMAFVNGGIEGRAYAVAPGNRVYLFDTDGHTFYVKAVDYNGMPLPFKTYDYTEVIEAQLPAQSSYANGDMNAQSQVDLSGYIKRDEVENMIAAEVEKRIAAMNIKAGTTKKGGETGA